MNTRDLSEFGYRELDMAADLLKAFKGNNNKTETFGYGGVAVEFNPSSGNVFLVDEDYNVAMMTSNSELEDFYVLAYAGHEGFVDDLIYMYNNGEIENAEDVEQLQNICELHNKSIKVNYE